MGKGGQGVLEKETKEEIMTWRELKEAIENMPEEQKDEVAVAFREEDFSREVSFVKTDYPLYAYRGDDCCFKSCEISDEDLQEGLEEDAIYLVYGRGKYYLDAN